MSRSKSTRKQTPASTQTVVWITAGAFALLAVCCGCWFALAPLMQSVTGPATQKVAPAASAELTIAYSPEKADLFKSLVDGFNAQGNKAPGGLPMVVKTLELEPDAMVAAAVAGNFQAMSPDSSIWLDRWTVRGPTRTTAKARSSARRRVMLCHLSSSPCGVTLPSPWAIPTRRWAGATCWPKRRPTKISSGAIHPPRQLRASCDAGRVLCGRGQDARLDGRRRTGSTHARHGQCD